MTGLIPINSAPKPFRSFLKKFDKNNDDQLNPKEASAVVLACKKKRHKDCDAAIRFLNNYQVRPNEIFSFVASAKAHYNRAIEQYAEGRIDESIIELKTALNARPGYASALILLSIAYSEKANILEGKGERSAAIAMYEAAIENALLFINSVNIKFVKEGVRQLRASAHSLERLRKN